MAETVSFNPHEEPVVVYEPVTPIVHEPNFAVVDGRMQAHPEGKVIERPTYVRPRGRNVATTKGGKRSKATDTTETTTESTESE